jgi:hypothetical protein
MRLAIASILIGSLALIGALPAAAGDESTNDKDAYTRKAHNDVQEWHRKLDSFDRRVETAGKETGKAAQADLNMAWTKTQAASRQLETAGADGWDKAKSAFEKASDDLADTWHRNVPDDK